MVKTPGPRNCVSPGHCHLELPGQHSTPFSHVTGLGSSSALVNSTQQKRAEDISLRLFFMALDVSTLPRGRRHCAGHYPHKCIQWHILIGYHLAINTTAPVLLRQKEEAKQHVNFLPFHHDFSFDLLHYLLVIFCHPTSLRMCAGYCKPSKSTPFIKQVLLD